MANAGYQRIQFMERVKRLTKGQRELLEQVGAGRWVIYSNNRMCLPEVELPRASGGTYGSNTLSKISFDNKNRAIEGIATVMSDARKEKDVHELRTGEVYLYIAPDAPDDGTFGGEGYFFVEKVCARNIIRLRNMTMDTLLGEV